MLNRPKKWTAFFIIVCLLIGNFGLAAGAAGGEPVNLVTNPGFESGSTGWNLQGDVFSISTEEKHSGENSMKITGQGNWLRAAQWIDVQANTDYILKFYGKSSSAGASYYVRNAEDSVTLGTSGNVISDGTWREYTVEFNSGSYTTIMIKIYDGDTGIHYFDDFALTATSEPSEPPDSELVNFLANPSVEDDVTGNWQLPSQFTVDNTVARTGTKSIKLTGISGWASLKQYVNVEPNTDYTFTFYSKGDTGAIFKVLKSAEPFPAISEQKTAAAGDDWAENFVTFNSGDNSQVIVYIADEVAGTIQYFDDFALLGPPVKQAEELAEPVLNSAVDGNGQVTLSWSAVPGATGYRVKYGTVSATYTSVKSVTTGISTDITGLTNNTTYYFAVAAYNDGDESDLSNELSATPNNAPRNLLVNSSFESDVTGNWQLPSQFTVDSTVARTGTKSIKLTGKSGWSSLRQYVNVEPNSEYTFKFYSKGDIGAIFKVLKSAEPFPAISEQKTAAAGEDWTENSVTFDSSNNSQVIVYIADEVAGTIQYFDDVELIGPPPSGKEPEPEPEPEEEQPITGLSLFTDFVTRNGDKLMDGDQELRFISVNIPGLLVLEDGGFHLPSPWEQEDAFKSVVQMGGQVIRTYTLTVKSPSDTSETKFHVMAPGVFDEDFFKVMDQALALANMNGVRLIIPFVDQWSFHGGVTEYAAFRGKKGPNAPDYSKDFWTDPEIKADFKKTIEYVLNRTNTLTGIKYKDDKAILGWQTGNELQSLPEWDAEMAAYIKSIDSNHLVIDGTRGVKPTSVDNDNIDVIVNHGYRLFGEDLVARASAGRAETIGKKPFVFGEFGLSPTEEILALMDEVVENGSTGAMIWSLRYHNKNGGFYWHGEGSYKNIAYYSYHWPGFSSNDPYDGTNVINAIRENAYRIQGKPVPALTVPDAPRLFDTNSVTKLSWRGSTGASLYDIERASSTDGPWTVVKKDISDNLYQGIKLVVSDKTVIPGETYYYRVRAKNSGGVSLPSNVIGPLVAGAGTGGGSNNGSGIIDSRTSGFIKDEFNDFSRIYSYTGNLEVFSTDPERFGGDTARIARTDNGDASIIYASAGNMNSFKVDTYFWPGLASISDFKFFTSSDNNAYMEFMPNISASGSEWKKFTYEAYLLPSNTRYLKIEFGEKASGLGWATQISRVHIGYGDNQLPAPVGGQLTKAIDDFEGYSGSNSDLQAAYISDTSGNDAVLALSSNTKNDGTFGLKYEYTLDDIKDYAGVIKGLQNDSWTGKNALEFWLKPDGSNNRITMKIKETSGDTWVASYGLSGTTPVLVQMPFVKFVRLMGDMEGNGVFELNSIDSLSLYVEKGDSQINNGIVYFDSIRVITLPIIDDFENYSNDEALQSAYTRNSGGGNLTLTLDSIHKYSGVYGMKLDYAIGASGYAGVDKELGSANWSGNNGIQFWLKPDGSNKNLTIQFSEVSGEVWNAVLALADTEESLIKIPFTDFVRPSWSQGNGAIDLGSIGRIGIYVDKASGMEGSGVLYLDSFEVAQMQLVEDFEYYSGDSARVQSNYTRDGSGDAVKITLDNNIKNDGSYAMKYEYTIGTNGYSAVTRKMARANWAGSSALSLWLKPDGSNHTLIIQAKEATGESWEAQYILVDSSEKVLEIPFSSFVRSTGSNGDNVFDTASIVEISYKVSRGKGSAGDGIIYLDSIALCNTKVIDSFDFYDDAYDLVENGAYMTNMGGGPIKLNADSVNKNDGYYGLKYQYSVGQKGYGGVGKRLNGVSWAGADAIRFWLKPDGTKNILKVQFRETPKGNDPSSETWEAAYSLSGTADGYVVIPFSEFKLPKWYADQNNPWDNGIIDLDSIGDFWLYVDKTTDPTETVFASTIYCDSIEAVDSLPPMISLDQTEDATVYKADFTVSGYINETAAVKINNEAVVVNPDKTFSRILILAAGQNIVTVEAVDIAGNKSIKTLKVTFEAGTVKTVPVLVDNGVALASVSAEQMIEAFNQVNADDSGMKAVKVEIEAVEEVGKYMLLIPTRLLTADTRSKKIEIKTPTGTVIVSNNMFSEKDLSGKDTVGICIGTADITKLNHGMQKKVGTSPAVELFAATGESKLAWKNKNAPVTVIVDYTPTPEELKDPEHIAVWYIDGSGKANEVKTARYDAGSGKLIFTVTDF